jgi:hypothetical protein
MTDLCVSLVYAVTALDDGVIIACLATLGGPYLLAFPMMVMETISYSNRITQWICVVTETACFV